MEKTAKKVNIMYKKIVQYQYEIFEEKNVLININ